LNGGGGGARNGSRIPPIFGPPGSGAIITPGPNWPDIVPYTGEDLVKKYGFWIVLAALVLLTSRE